MNSISKTGIADIKRIVMRRGLFFFVLIIAGATQVFPRVVTTFPEMAKPIELKVDDSFFYISDQYSVFVYNKKTLKQVKRLGRRGEGPQEFQAYARIGLANNLTVYDNYKIIEFSKKFEFLKEVPLRSHVNRVIPVGNNFVFEESKTIDGKSAECFNLYDNNKKFVKHLVIEYDHLYPDRNKYVVNPFSVARCWNNKVYISQPLKGFNFVVFNESGKKLYEIEKKIDKIKYEKKHNTQSLDKLRYFLGSKMVERILKRNKKIPISEFVPDINNFWVDGNRIYVKTFDIKYDTKDKTEKYIIMDLKGNIQKEVFLPVTFMEILTFHNNKFYYLQESGNDENEGWVLHEMIL